MATKRKSKPRAAGVSKVGKTAIKVGLREPDNTPKGKTHPATGKPPKTIRMLMSLASQHGSWVKGNVYRVPQEVPVPTARSWVRSGAAEMVTE